MAVKAGKNVRISIDLNDAGSGGAPNWVEIGQQRDSSLQKRKDTSDATYKSNQGWKRAISTQKSWSITVDGLLDPADSAWSHLKTNFDNDTLTWVQIDDSGIGGSPREGQVHITTLDESYPTADSVAFTCEIQGDGPLSVI